MSTDIMTGRPKYTLADFQPGDDVMIRWGRGDWTRFHIEGPRAADGGARYRLVKCSTGERAVRLLSEPVLRASGPCNGPGHPKPTPAPKSLTLDESELRGLEEMLQRDAVGMLQTGIDREHAAYRANRALFGKVWDALYA